MARAFSSLTSFFLQTENAKFPHAGAMFFGSRLKLLVILHFLKIYDSEEMFTGKGSFCNGSFMRFFSSMKFRKQTTSGTGFERKQSRKHKSVGGRLTAVAPINNKRQENTCNTPSKSSLFTFAIICTTIHYPTQIKSKVVPMLYLFNKKACILLSHRHLNLLFVIPGGLEPPPREPESRILSS